VGFLGLSWGFYTTTYWKRHTGYLFVFDLIPIKRIEAWLFLRLKRESDACLGFREFVIGFIFFIGGFQMIFNGETYCLNLLRTVDSIGKERWDGCRGLKRLGVYCDLLWLLTYRFDLEIANKLSVLVNHGTPPFPERTRNNIHFVPWSCPISHRLENYRLIYKRVKIEHTQTKN